MAEHEEAIARLYGIFAGCQRPLAAFWQALSKEETVHSNILKTMEKRLHEGTLQFKRPDFYYKAVIESLENVRSRARWVIHSGISIRDALDYAIRLEKGMIESRFFDVLDSDDAESRREFASLLAFNREHVRQITDEASRLRWKIFGKKVWGGAGRRPAGITTREYLVGVLAKQVARSQDEVLEMLAWLEEAIGALYAGCAEVFRGDPISELWHGLFLNEMDHAAMVRKVKSVLREKGEPFSIAGVEKETLEMDINNVLDAEYDVRKGKMDLETAIKTALDIESRLADGRIYRSIRSDAPEFTVLARQMEEMSRRHVTDLSAMLSRKR